MIGNYGIHLPLLWHVLGVFQARKPQPENRRTRLGNWRPCFLSFVEQESIVKVLECVFNEA
jgi:hypothetical protein